MANIEIANICNLECPYCFAQDHMQAVSARSGLAFISPELFEKRLDFLDRSGINQVRLIGGEPTLHPKFPDLIRQAQLHNKQIMVFSHGLMPKHALATLEALSPNDCIVLINMNSMKMASGPTRKEQIRRLETIKLLGPRVLLGYNIYKTNFVLDFLLPIILEANCRKSIRVGIAQPTFSGKNIYLRPKEYPIVGQKLVEFCQVAAKFEVTLEFDCGFVRCMFSDEDIEILHQAKADIGWHCSPILDVDMQGHAIHCFPLAGKVETVLNDSVNATTLRHELVIQSNFYRMVGIYRECSMCAFKQSGECSGGGLEHIMHRFRHTPFHLPLPSLPLNTQALS